MFNVFGRQENINLLFGYYFILVIIVIINKCGGKWQRGFREEKEIFICCIQGYKVI